MKARNRSNYERYGDLFFVTSTVVGFVQLFNHPAICDIFIRNLRYYQDRGDIIIIAYVLMPSHFHIVLKSEDRRGVSGCVANLKRITSRQIREYLEFAYRKGILGELKRKAALEPAEECRIWKPRFDCFVLTNEDTLRQKIEYIHHNPVRKGLVAEPTEWRYSSARNYAGITPLMIEVDTEWSCLGYGRRPSGKGS